MTATPSIHVPVLLDEILHWLNPCPGQTIVDGTVGGGGHTRALAERVSPGGRVISLDRDPAVIAAAAAWQNNSITAVQANFRDLPEVLDELEIETVDGILLDLGLSSDQLADRERGFSFSAEGPLDMRFDPMKGKPAWRLIERLSAEHLADMIYLFGEERYSRRIARAIVDRRHDRPIQTAAELADLVRSVVPRSRRDHIDPATRTFQALRIYVNEELKSLEIALRRLPDRLKPGGRLAIISFHSLEDRPVKEAFRDDPRLEALVKKPIMAGDEEAQRNPRARSAKLRIASRR